MGTNHAIDNNGQYQRWVWGIHPQCVICQAQETVEGVEGANCRFRIPISATEACLFMKPKEG